MAQINPTVGDIVGNTRLIQTWIKEARQAKADLVAFPELAITGYPPEDLLNRPDFLSDCEQALQDRNVTSIVITSNYSIDHLLDSYLGSPLLIAR